MDSVIPHWLTKQAYLVPERTALELESGEVISFFELKEESETFAKKLQTLGIKKGDHVGILSTNNPSFIIGIHALSYIGAVAVLLNTRLTKDEIAYQLSDSDTSFILTCDSLERFARGLPRAIKTRTFSEINTLHAGDYVIRDEIKLDEAFTIIYTSGTTGFPKGVVHTYGNQWWSAVGSALNLGMLDSDKWLATLPFFHVGGLSIFIRSVIYGIPVYMVEKFSAEAVHHAIMKKGVTIASVVPVMLKRLIEHLDEGSYPAGFRCMLLGGSAAPPMLLEQAKSRCVPVFQSYGMTETSSQIVTLSPSEALDKVGSSGKSLLPAQVRIHNKGNDGIGEVHVKGPMVTKGYYNNESETKKTFSNGWLSTGDLGYMDKDGFIYIVDRRKDLIVSGGENVYPREVEEALLSIDGIDEAGVIGIDDKEWGKVPVACIVGNGTALTREQILASLKKSLAGFKIPKKFFFMDDLPKNASQKLLRSELLKYLKQKKTIT